MYHNPSTEIKNPFLRTKIEQLQQAQAKLQRENRQKQKVLKETITEKFTKTAEQAKLLKTLQEEVASIEKELSCDISILRDRIDHCNRRYCEARLFTSSNSHNLFTTNCMEFTITQPSTHFLIPIFIH